MNPVLPVWERRASLHERRISDPTIFHIHLTGPTFGQKSTVWKELKIANPYTFVFGRHSSTAIGNKDAVNLLRRMSFKIHKKSLYFLENAMEWQKSFYENVETKGHQDAFTSLSNVICDELFRGKIGKNVYQFYDPRMLKRILEITPSQNICFDARTEIYWTDLYQNFLHFLIQSNVYLSYYQLESILYGFVSFINSFALDIHVVLELWNRQIQEPREMEVIEPDVFDKSLPLNEFLVINRLDNLRKTLMCRNNRSSHLFLEILFTDRLKLLELVFDWPLLNRLPIELRDYLLTWMDMVRDKLRRLLAHPHTVTLINRYLLTEGRNENEVKLQDENYRNFIVQLAKMALKVTELLLETDVVRVTQPEWATYIEDGLLTDSVYLVDLRKYLSTLEKIDVNLDAKLQSFFGNTDSEVATSLLTHCRAQILRFFIDFVAHSIKYFTKIELSEDVVIGQLVYDKDMESNQWENVVLGHYFEDDNRRMRNWKAEVAAQTNKNSPRDENKNRVKDGQQQSWQF